MKIYTVVQTAQNLTLCLPGPSSRILNLHPQHPRRTHDACASDTSNNGFIFLDLHSHLRFWLAAITLVFHLRTCAYSAEGENLNKHSQSLCLLRFCFASVGFYQPFLISKGIL